MRRVARAAAVLLALAGCEVDGVLVLQLLDGAEWVSVQVFDAGCEQPFESDAGAMFAEPVRINGPVEDGGRVGLPVAPAAQEMVVRVELEAHDKSGGIERWCACPRLPGSGEVSAPIPVRAARGTPEECQVINLDDVRFAQRDNGEPCAFDFECRSFNCECTDADCSDSACAADACLCGFFDGASCVVRTAEGGEPIHDPEDCLGDAECVGLTCLLATGSTGCGRDSECASGHCACASAGCGETACSEVGCDVCQWVDAVASTCEGAVETGEVAPNCSGVCTETGCHLQGTLDPGDRCNVDSDCEDRCWCANEACGVKKCTANDADCTYDEDGDGEPDGFLYPGVDDPDDSCGGGSACAAGGACAADAGVTCTADSDCAHGHCECTTESCGATRCNQVDCPCQYDADNSDYACEGSLSRFTDDANDSCGAGLTCDGNGSCHADTGAECFVAAECESDACADRRCCDKPCTGACDRCDVDGSEGECVVDDTLCTGNCDRCGASGACEPVPGDCDGACGACQADGDSFNCRADESQCSPPVGPICAQCADTGNGTTWECTFDATADSECSAADNECTAVDTCTGPAGAECAEDIDCTDGRCGPLGYCCAADSPCAGGVSAGATHTCATLRSNLVRCWGEGSYGAVGDGDTSAHTVPSPIAVPVSGAALNCGDRFTCAQVGDNLGCWGRNDYGQLGMDATVSLPGGVGSITVPDDLVCLQTGDCPPSGNALANVVSFASGRSHACAAVDVGTTGDSTDDEARCWGRNEQGQLGSSAAGDQAAPVVVCDSQSCLGALIGVTAVSAGIAFACAVTNGLLRCWGDNFYGQLGNGSRTDGLPTQVMRRDLGVALTNVVGIAAGGQHACGLDVSGSVWCWGRNALGEVGVDTGTCTGGDRDGAACTVGGDCTGGGACDGWVTAAVEVSLASATMVTAGGNHTCALTASEEIWCWGENTDGQLGDGKVCGDACVDPVRVESSALARPVAIEAGSNHTCAVDADGEVWCWGRNNHDQLGNSAAASFEDEPVPVTNWP